MDTLLLLTILIVICALVFDFINGFHDTANAIATSVSTKALKPRHAIVMAAIMNFLGAMTFTGVAKTITKDIVNPYTLDNGSVVILAALLAAIVWNLITWYFGIPAALHMRLSERSPERPLRRQVLQRLIIKGSLKLSKHLFYHRSSPLFSALSYIRS